MELAEKAIREKNGKCLSPQRLVEEICTGMGKRHTCSADIAWQNELLDKLSAWDGKLFRRLFLVSRAGLRSHLRAVLTTRPKLC